MKEMNTKIGNYYYSEDIVNDKYHPDIFEFSLY